MQAAWQTFGPVADKTDSLRKKMGQWWQLCLARGQDSEILEQVPNSSFFILFNIIVYCMQFLLSSLSVHNTTEPQSTSFSWITNFIFTFLCTQHDEGIHYMRALQSAGDKASAQARCSIPYTP